MRGPASVLVLLGLLCTVANASADPLDQLRSALAVVRMQPKSLPGASSGHGTGWLVSYDGFVITAAHVVTGEAKYSWTDVVVSVELMGQTYAAEVRRIEEKFDDIALLKINFPDTHAAQLIFDQFEVGALSADTDVWLLGFEEPNSLTPGMRRDQISAVAGAKYHAKGETPHGYSGGPVLSSRDGKVAGVALAVHLGMSRRPVRSEYLQAHYLHDLLDYARRHGDVRRPGPRWLRTRPGLPFRQAELNRVVNALKAGQAVIVTGGPGIELSDFAVEAGYQLWEAMGLLPANLLYVRPHTSDEGRLSTVLAEIASQLYLDSATPQGDIRREAEIRRRLAGTGPYAIVVDGAKIEEDIVETTLGLRGPKTPLLVTSPTHFWNAAFDLHEPLAGLAPDQCLAYLMTEARTEFKRREEREAARAICKKLGGLPLAIRPIAGAIRYGGVRPAAILTGIDSVDGMTDLEQLVRPVLQLLRDNERQILARLSVLPEDGFSARAAAATARVNEQGITFTFSRLRKLRLVEEVGPERYRLNALVRLLAASLHPSLVREARRDYASFYLTEFGGSYEHWLQEWPNIALAIELAVSLPPIDAAAILRQGMPRILPVMMNFGQWSMYQQWAARWLDIARAAGDVLGRRAALLSLAKVDIRMGKDGLARARILEAQSLTGPARDALSSRTQILLAQLELMRSFRQDPPNQPGFARAREFAVEGLGTAEGLDESIERNELLAAAHHLLGMIATAEGRETHAYDSLARSIAIATAHSLEWQLVASQYQLAAVEARRDRLEEAERAFGQVLATAQRSRFDEAQAASLYALAIIACQRGQLDASAQQLSRAITIYERLGSRFLDQARKDLQQVLAALAAKASHVEECSTR